MSPGISCVYLIHRKEIINMKLKNLLVLAIAPTLLIGGVPGESTNLSVRKNQVVTSTFKKAYTPGNFGDYTDACDNPTFESDGVSFYFDSRTEPGVIGQYIRFEFYTDCQGMENAWVNHGQYEVEFFALLASDNSEIKFTDIECYDISATSLAVHIDAYIPTSQAFNFKVYFRELGFDLLQVDQYELAQESVIDGFTYQLRQSILTDGASKDIYLNVENQTSQATILSMISAVDLFGADVTVTVKTSDYTINRLGDFSIVIQGSDEYAQTATATLLVHVLDKTAPVINNKNVCRFRYGTKITKEDLLEYFTISDNASSSGSTWTTSFDFPEGISLNTSMNVGNYSGCHLTAIDNSGNSSSYTFNIEVFDDVAPVISKKDGSGTNIEMGCSRLMDLNTADLLALYKADDVIDGSCDVYIKSGSINNYKVGDQTIILGAKDKKNNETSLTITLTSIADIPPVFILDTKLFSTTSDCPLNVVDLTSLVNNYVLAEGDTFVGVSAKAYLSTPATVGTYSIDYSYLDASEATQSSSFTLQVVEAQEKEDKSIWQVISDWFAIIGQNISNFFVKLWHFLTFRGWTL